MKLNHKLSTAAALILFSAPPVLADTQAAMPIGGYGIVCVQPDNGSTPECNVPVTFCNEAKDGHVLACLTTGANLPTVQMTGASTACATDGEITTCRTVNRQDG